MKVIPKGIGFNGLIKLTFLAFNIYKQYGFRTLWRKLSNKFSNKEEQEYPVWILKNEPSEKDLSDQKTLAEKFSYRPLISIIMPVFNPKAEVLQDAIHSVLNQTYYHWELCIADGSEGTSGSEIRTLLSEYVKRDSRIKVKYLNNNNGISGNSNKALETAEGDFIAFLDHDDQIAPFALFRIVERLNQDQDIDVLYSDRDLLSWDGRKRYHPLFKPDWSPELLVSVNYLIHLCVVRKDLVERVGGFLSEMDGAQDWDLFFRVTELTSKIVHIPEILYHWRVGPTSAAWSLAAKPYVVKAQIQAIKNHFGRNGIDVDVSLGPSGFIRINWKNVGREKASVIIINQRSLKNLEKFLKNILAKTKFIDYEIVLVGNKVDRPEIQSVLTKGPICKVNPPVGLTLSELRNLGAEKAAGKVLIFIDENLEVLDSDWLNELAGWAVQKEIGAVGGKILNADRTLHSVGLIISEDKKIISPFSGMKEYYGKYGSSEWYRNYPAVSWDCLAVRKEVFEEVNQFDTNAEPDSGNIDFCLRIQKIGYRNVYSPYTRVRTIG